MKKNKRIIATTFCVGAMIFAVTSYADIVAKTGYGQLKESLKLTVGKFTKGDANFSTDISMSIKDGSKSIYTTNTKSKNDKDKSESVKVDNDMWGGNREVYSYYDKNVCILKEYKDGPYSVTNYKDGSNTSNLNEIPNPFEHEKAKGIEKIVDALVGNFNGNLKDFIVLNENENGTKEISTKISQGQVPSLASAVFSFLFKEFYNDYQGDENYDEKSNKEEPVKLKEDVFIKNIEGKGLMNKEGIIENMLVTASVSAINTKGITHEYTFDLLIKVYNIGTTLVEKPDLTGKKVEEYDYSPQQAAVVSKKFIGKYKSDIIISSNDQRTNLGERTIEITKIDDDYVYGSFYERVTTEGTEYIKSKDFSFKARVNDKETASILDENDVTNGERIKKSKGEIYFDSNSGGLSFNMNTNPAINGAYTKVLE